MNRLLVAALPLVLLPTTACESALPSRCNGHVELCDRRYDQVTFAATHNSMASTEENAIAPNQTYPMRRQLEDGIRGFMLDSHVDDATGLAMLCHTLCGIESLTLEQGLSIFAAFLRKNRGEVVTLIFESYVPAEQTAAAFEASGAIDFVYTHALGQPWPTLREMVESNQRLVVLTDAGGSTGAGPYPWYMDQFAYAFQNPYAAQTVDDFACYAHRGSASNPVFIMNHFLTAPLASLALSMQANTYEELSSHVQACTAELGRPPTFLTVDYYETGALFRVVDEANGL